MTGGGGGGGGGEGGGGGGGAGGAAMVGAVEVEQLMVAMAVDARRIATALLTTVDLTRMR